MGEVRQLDFSLDVIGYVDEDHDFHATVDAAVVNGLVERLRSDAKRQKANDDIRVRFFAGSVANHDTFVAVQETPGVASLEREQTVTI